MGIKTEFNPDLALRNIESHRIGKRKVEECIPDKLEAGNVHEFLKEGQRNYWLEGEIPLVETDDSKLSKPLASIIILECTHFLDNGKVFTKGKYIVKEVFDGSKIHFDGFARVK